MPFSFRVRASARTSSKVLGGAVMPAAVNIFSLYMEEAEVVVVAGAVEVAVEP